MSYFPASLRRRVPGTSLVHLLKHCGKIKVIPRLDNLAIPLSQHAHTRKGQAIPLRRLAQALPGVGCSHCAATRAQIALLHYLLHRYMKIGQRGPEASIEGLEALAAVA